LYHPKAGSIAWDKINFKNASLTDLRQRISVIYQDISKYQLSIGENIQIGDLASPLSETTRQTAAEKSGAIGYIETFPKRYDQKLGRWLKKSSELNDWQSQKIRWLEPFTKCRGYYFG
jgi:ATP-binding cassette subfamily B protein